AAPPAWCRAARVGPVLAIEAGGRWTLSSITALQAQLSDCEKDSTVPARLDLKALTTLDSAGAWILHRFVHRLRGRGQTVDVIGATPAQRALLERMVQADSRQALARPYVSPAHELVERVGHATFEIISEAAAMVAFYGQIVISIA